LYVSSVGEFLGASVDAIACLLYIQDHHTQKKHIAMCPTSFSFFYSLNDQAMQEHKDVRYVREARSGSLFRDDARPA
jgi:hypothetical protein